MPRSSLGHSWVWFHNKAGESGDIPIALFSHWLNGQSQSVFHGITLTNSSHQHKPPWRSYCCQAWTVETVYRDSNVGILENKFFWRFHGSGAIVAPQTIGLISFCTSMHHGYFFEVVNVLSCPPFIFENKHDVIQGLELGRTQCKGRVAGSPWFTWCNPGVGITTRPVYTVCASAVISPLRQWLDSYAKTRFKMCHTFKHLLICNTFCCRLILLSLSLYIELALVCCTDPNNVNCFGTIFPILNFVFASIWAASPVHIESDWGATKTALWLWVCEITCYLYTRWVHGRMKTKQRWFKVTRELSHEWFHHFRHHLAPCSWRPLDWRIRHSHLAPTLFHSLVPWWRPRRIRPQITRLSQLENFATGTWPIYKNSIIPNWFEKMAWYKILIHVLIV